MKYLTKRWMNTLEEIKQTICNAGTSRKIKKKIAWLENRAKKASRAFEKVERLCDFEADFDDFLECKIQAFSVIDGDVEIKIENKGYIKIYNAKIIQMEINIKDFAEKVILRAVEMYYFKKWGNTIQLLLEKEGGNGEKYFYLSVIGSSIEMAKESADTL